jgi:RHS repeat-associated protein
MPSQNEEVLCTYHYDPLDSLIGFNSAKPDALQRFYCKTRLATEIQGLARCSIVQQGDQLLAQQKRLGDAQETALLATDQQRSVMQTVGGHSLPIVYSPYGHLRAESGLTSLLGFNGERPDAVTGHYLLGNGFRAFNPVLMRFNSSDSLSPFGKGGLNSYAYCLGDPVNGSDPTGHMRWFSLSTMDFTNFKRDPTFASMSKFTVGHRFSHAKHLNNLENPLSNSNVQLAKWRSPKRFSNRASVDYHSVRDSDPLNLEFMKKNHRIDFDLPNPDSSYDLNAVVLNPKLQSFISHREKHYRVLDELEKVADFDKGKSILPTFSRAHANLEVGISRYQELLLKGNNARAREVLKSAMDRFDRQQKKIRESQ